MPSNPDGSCPTTGSSKKLGEGDFVYCRCNGGSPLWRLTLGTN